MSDAIRNYLNKAYAAGMTAYNSGKINPPTEIETLDRLEAELRDALEFGMTVAKEPDRVPRQPDIGGFCDECGHLAARHDERGCSGVKRPCSCQMMQWDGYKWPRPWLAAPEGLRNE